MTVKSFDDLYKRIYKNAEAYLVYNFKLDREVKLEKCKLYVYTCTNEDSSASCEVSSLNKLKPFDKCVILIDWYKKDGVERPTVLQAVSQ